MVKRWDSLQTREKIRKINKSLVDPLFFIKDPYLLDIEAYPVQKMVVREFYKRHYQGLIDELVHVAGMRGGKTTEASMFGTYELFKLLASKTPWKTYNLLPDSWIYVTNLATEEKQAKRTIFAHMVARMENSPFFQATNYDDFTMRWIWEEEHVECHAIPSSAASQVGSTIKCVLYDEVARLSQKRGDEYAWFVYHSLRNGTKTFGMKGIKVSISSPVHSSDLIMTLYDEAYKPQQPKKRYINPYSIGFMHKTWEMNPHLTFEDFAPDFARDPRAAARDFGCDPRRSEYLFFDNPVILKVNTRRDNLLEMMVDGTLSPSDINRDYHYVAAGDPAYRINAFGIALAHGVSEIDWIDNELITEAGIRQFLEDFPFSGVVVDGLWRFEPSENPIKPDKVLDFFLDMVEHWEVGHVGFDIWQYPSIHQALNEYGVEVYTEQLKKEDFDNMKDLLALGRLDICNYPYVLDEMSKLLLNNTETKVIKPKNASKDVTDALVHTVKLLIEVDWSEPNLMQYFVKTA